MLDSLRQFGENKFIAHVTEVEHEILGEVGIQVDRDPRAPVGVVAREYRIGIFGVQLEDTVGVALEREQMSADVGRLGVVLCCELAGKLLFTNPINHHSHFSWNTFVAPGCESRRASMAE